MVWWPGVGSTLLRSTLFFKNSTLLRINLLKTVVFDKTENINLLKIVVVQEIEESNVFKRVAV